MDSEVTFRRATLSDRQGVLDIDPFLFDGLDYMPSMYTQILQNPAYRAYVAETHDKKIVSFMALMIDPDPEHGFSCIVSGRTKKEYQGQGIYSRLREDASRDEQAEFGQNFERLFVSSDKPVYSEKFWSDPNRLLIDRQADLVYIAPHARVVETEAALKISPRVTNINVEELQTDRAYQVLLDNYTLQHVLRKSHIKAFCNSLPLPKSPKYLRMIASQCKIFASFKNSPTAKSNGISYSSIIKGPIHVNVNIALLIYEHVDVLLAHLAKHMGHVADVVPPNATVAFRFIFPAEIDKEVVKDFLRPTLGVNRVGKVYPMEFTMLWREEVPTANQSKL